jgi:hypothetical protein
VAVKTASDSIGLKRLIFPGPTRASADETASPSRRTTDKAINPTLRESGRETSGGMARVLLIDPPYPKIKRISCESSRKEY